VTAALVQRVAALAGVALLAALAALAVAGRWEGPHRSTLPARVPVPGGGWYHATAAVPRGQVGRRTSCGLVVTPSRAGLGDPVLPCGAKIYILFGSTQVLTQVIDRSVGAPDHRFDLTPALAGKLGVTGVQPVRWAFARCDRTSRCGAAVAG
jgi:hypothetical protein